MYEDAKRLSETLVSESLFETQTKGGEVVRLEARTGVVGSLRKLISDIDAIKKNNGVRSQKWMAERLDRLSDSVDRLVENLRSEEDQQLVQKGLLEEAEKVLPKTPAPVPRRPFSQEHIDAYRKTRRDLVESLRDPE